MGQRTAPPSRRVIAVFTATALVLSLSCVTIAVAAPAASAAPPVGAWLTSATGKIFGSGGAPALTSAAPPPPGTLIADIAPTASADRPRVASVAS
jgi:hypothetical protein